jgi:hypothetical protein
MMIKDVSREDCRPSKFEGITQYWAGQGFRGLWYV